MIPAYAVDDVRRAEARAMAGIPDGLLMQRAASALAVTIAGLLPRGVYGARLVLLVGAGNNGGDALWAGARLAARGARVDAVLVADQAHEAGLAALTAAGGRTHRGDGTATRTALAEADVVVDGLLGIGGRAGLDELSARLVGAAPDDSLVVAVDLPSGVDPETGATPGEHVWADVTVSFGLAKPCLFLPPADRAAGEVRVVDIGLGAHLRGIEPALEHWTAADVAAVWPVPGPQDDKYSRGVLGVVAGGSTYTGAAVLCSGAAVQSGAGMVRYVGPDAPTDLVRARWPEVVPGPGQVQAWVLGPGVDTESDAPGDVAQRAAIETALDHDRPCVVDAGALGLLPERREAPTLLTPHAGELARLLSRRGGASVDRAAVEAEPLRHARRASELTGATVLLKGATTVLVGPDGDGHVVRTAGDGPGWLATAGSGDVLAGIAGTLLAAGLDPLDAGSTAVVVHGRAGRQASAGGPISAEAVLRAVPAVLAESSPDRGAHPPGQHHARTQTSGVTSVVLTDLPIMGLPAVAEIDLTAIRGNVAALRGLAGSAEVMAVVKADAYGHGLVPCAEAALAGGATWLGVAQLAEGLALRRAGVGGRLLSWLHVPGDDFAAALRADIDLSVSATWALAEIRAAAADAGRPARIQLKADTGLSRNGCPPDDWPGLVAEVARAVAEGSVEVTGVWSHLACADQPGHPSTTSQRERFGEMCDVVERAGVAVPLRHLANSAATLTDPTTHFDLVRPGLAVYGLSPVPDLGDSAAYGLTPAMTLRGRLAVVKQVPAGTGVSYGHDYVTDRDTTLALVPLGYADGVPRSTGNRAEVQVGGQRRTIAGRVCMDQFVVDLGPVAQAAAAGDDVVLFGSGRNGEPTAEDWGAAAGTISYEIVSRVGARVPRTYRGADA